MTSAPKYVTTNGHELEFQNREGLYPVNQYQSLLLAFACELAAMSIAWRKGSNVESLSAWEPCCGGGPAALALKALGLHFVQATDISPPAIAACQVNAERNGLLLDSVRSVDMLNDGSDRKYDLIACNPPCSIGEPQYGRTPIEVAVFGGADGTDLTVRLLADSLARLSPEGVLIFIAVSTGNVRKIDEALNRLHAGRWKAYPPIAAPYARPEDPKAIYLSWPSLPYSPMVWRRPDSPMIWRLSWVVEVRRSSIGPVVSSRNKAGGFPLLPLGYDLNQDEGLCQMICENSGDGYWLD